ncbi:MAG: phosphoglucosamine mutase [Pyrinomonadaceae bacterium]|nr:phosphoglucosamine mutase [Pyrinomonadaceae bacterium]
MKKLFGTDGIRGEAGTFPLDKTTISAIGASLAAHLTEKNGHAPRFVVGRDTRESGTWIEHAFQSGASSGGAICESAGVITTPGVAYITKAAEFDAGIVISASHNPFQDNGLKVFLPTGQKLDKETESLIENDIHEGNVEKTEDESEPIDESKIPEYQEMYIRYLINEFTGLDLSGLKIVVDCANGAASGLAPDLFKNLGAEVVVINDQPDGKNINENCGSLHLENVQAKLVQESADFGVAFDGDADRSLFVDEKGEIADGDATLWVMAQHLQSEGKLNRDTVVATVMSNIGLEMALRTRSIKLIRAAVGDKYVLQELLNSGASIGGEQSGHIIFPQRSLVGDGMQTALNLLEALQVNDCTLGEMRRGFHQYPQILVNVVVKEKRPFNEVPAIAIAAKNLDDELGETGRLLLRYSGTENLARVMIEGEDQETIEEQAQGLAKVIRESIG